MKAKSRGRPPGSPIRKNLAEILWVIRKGYGYEIARIYEGIFPRVTMRSIYYNLRKGVSTGEFRIVDIKNEKGEYSWGNEAEKVYYALGKNSAPRGNKQVKMIVESLKNRR